MAVLQRGLVSFFITKLNAVSCSVTEALQTIAKYSYDELVTLQANTNTDLEKKLLEHSGEKVQAKAQIIEYPPACLILYKTTPVKY